MELNTLSYSESPGQAILRDIPVAGYTRHHFSFLVVGDEEAVQDTPIVEVSREPKRESDIESFARKIPHHNSQFTRVDLNFCRRSGGLRCSSRL
jgi:hypothetical protein